MDIAALFILIGAIGGILSIVFPYYVWLKLKKLSTGEGKVQEVYKYIRSGAKAYLKREFKTIIIITVILTVIVALALGGWMAIAYVVGTGTSLAASFIGMDIATRTNVRAALAAKSGAAINRLAEKIMELTEFASPDEGSEGEVEGEEEE